MDPKSTHLKVCWGHKHQAEFTNVHILVSCAVQCGEIQSRMHAMLCIEDHWIENKEFLCLFHFLRELVSALIDFIDGSHTIRQEHKYLYIIVDKFSKMAILMPYQSNITSEEMTKLYFKL